ncbi:minor capsid protein, partial [Streptococcus equi subsp. equi]
SGRVTERSVSWHTPYARRLYYNPQYNFSKDKNPNAQGKWFEVAKANHAEHWYELTKKAYGAEFRGD